MMKYVKEVCEWVEERGWGNWMIKCKDAKHLTYLLYQDVPTYAHKAEKCFGVTNVHAKHTNDFNKFKNGW